MAILNDVMFHDLEVFAAVVELKSYKSAAQKLGIDLSGIGRRISYLEEELNCELVIRHNRNITITTDGVRLYQSFIPHIIAFNSMIDRFKDSSDFDGGEIDIAIPSGIIEYVLSKKIPEYLKQNPTLKINLVSQAREMNLVSEKYDFAILRHIPKQTNLKIRKLYAINIQLYCTALYKERYGVPETLADMPKHMILGRIRDDLTRIRKYDADNGKTRIAVYHDATFLTNNTAIDKQVVMSNEVIAGGNDYLYEDELARGEVIKVLPEYSFHADFQDFYLVSDGNKHKRKIVQDLMNYIIQVFSEIDG